MPRRIAEGVWLVEGASESGSSANRNFISNATVVETDIGLVVIDALGSPRLAAELREALRAITPKPVTHVIVTHYHADHIYGLQTFQAEGAQIIAQRQAGDYLVSDTARQRLQSNRTALFPWIDEHTRLVPPDRWIDAATTLTIGGMSFELQPVGPAHTAEDLVVWIPKRRLLVAGDLVFRGRIPFVGTADSRRWMAALDMLLGRDAQIIVPGHGPAVLDAVTARSDLEFMRDYLKFLRRTMGAAAHEMEPFDAAYARTDWSRYAGMPLFDAANRINAYNTYLLMEQQGPDP